MVEVEFLGGCMNGKKKMFPSMPSVLTYPRKFLGVFPLTPHSYLVGETANGIAVAVLYGGDLQKTLSRRM